MCGRFVQAGDPADYAAFLGAEPAVSESLRASWNVAPTDRVYAAAEHDGKRQLGTFRWGLIPWWSKDTKAAARHINARAETVATRPAFKDSFASRRCLIPADGFYEWEVRESGAKLPHYIHGAAGDPLVFAGLWASWRHPDTNERITSCTIITTRPNDLVAPIHDRMPVVLPEDAWGPWLDAGRSDPDELGALLAPVPAAMLAEHPVSSLVNSVKNNVPECLTPLQGPLP